MKMKRYGLYQGKIIERDNGKYVLFDDICESLFCTNCEKLKSDLAELLKLNHELKIKLEGK